MGVTGKGTRTQSKGARTQVKADVNVADLYGAQTWLLAAYALVAAAMLLIIWTRGELAEWIVEA